MKVLNLQCSQQHLFEGWFASESDFQDQLQRGLLLCPVCSDVTITKMLSAPRLNLCSAHGTSSAGSSVSIQGAPDNRLQTDWLAAARHLLESTDDVGAQFPELARKMHYGESEQRAIRGEATRSEALALLDEGIAVLPLLVPESLKKPLH